MTVRYSCEVNLRGVKSKIRKALTTKLDAEHYDWWYDNSTLIIEGETEVDSYDTNAGDVASEIDWIVESTTGIIVTTRAEAVEYEPDWDAMPGGYDAIWN